jgi:hypothetical protein
MEDRKRNFKASYEETISSDGGTSGLAPPSKKQATLSRNVGNMPAYADVHVTAEHGGMRWSNTSVTATTNMAGDEVSNDGQGEAVSEWMCISWKMILRLFYLGKSIEVSKRGDMASDERI